MLLYSAEVSEDAGEEEGAVQTEEANARVQPGGGNVSRAIHEGFTKGIFRCLPIMRFEN